MSLTCAGVSTTQSQRAPLEPSNPLEHGDRGYQHRSERLVGAKELKTTKIKACSCVGQVVLPYSLCRYQQGFLQDKLLITTSQRDKICPSCFFATGCLAGTFFTSDLITSVLKPIIFSWLAATLTTANLQN